MAKMDEGHVLTEKELSKLERRISSVYCEAAKELQESIDDYFQKFENRDAGMKSLIGTVQNGKEWTEEDYKRWRLNQIARGERFQALKNKLAHRITSANETAVAYVNDATPGIYSLNRNYAAYTIARVSGNADFTLWDEQTVKRLIVDKPDLMPYYPKKRAVKRGIDLAYGKKQITASITSSILQGKSIKRIADDLQYRLTTVSRDSAIRTARTAVTAAQNGGRMDSYNAAQDMGIKLKREWLATLDGRTRHAHAMLDGQQAEMGKPFTVDGYSIMYPGDPSAPGYLVYNCRCTLVAVVDGVDTSDAKRRTKDGLITDMTYAQWEASKRGHDGKQLSLYNKGNGSRVKDVSKKYLEKAQPRMGKVRYENGYKTSSHQQEIKVVSALHEKFGGKVTLLKESDIPGKMMPDFMWKGKQWEIKTISTEKAADSALRKAIKQIKDNPGGVVFDLDGNLNIDSLVSVLDDRAMRSKNYEFDVLAIKNGEFLFARRYRK